MAATPERNPFLEAFASPASTSTSRSASSSLPSSAPPHAPPVAPPVAAAVALPVQPFVHPPIDAMMDTVNRLSTATRATNTQRAYDDKIKEFKGFCDYKYYIITDQFMRHLVTHEKLYHFLFYTVFRGKKKTKRGVPAGTFSSTEYEDVYMRYSNYFAQINAIHGRSLTDNDIPDPENGCSFKVVENVVSAIKHLWSEQHLNHCNNYTWDQIHSPKINALKSLVKGRDKRTRKRTFADKVDETTNKFVNLNKFNSIEHEFWKKGGNNCSGKWESLSIYIFFAVLTLLFSLTGLYLSSQ